MTSPAFPLALNCKDFSLRHAHLICPSMKTTPGRKKFQLIEEEPARLLAGQAAMAQIALNSGPPVTISRPVDGQFKESNSPANP